MLNGENFGFSAAISVARINQLSYLLRPIKLTHNL
jgi:hypothetical protein